VYRHITLHCAISESDAARFQQLCSSKYQVVVTGDTRYEQVYRRAISVEPDTEFFPGQAIFNRSIFIAGSTYADDEEVILEAYQILRKDAPERLPHLILVPHEPTSERIDEILSVLNQRQLTYRCFSKLDNDVSFERIDVLIIDTVGILAKLYQLADIAFVGGSFHGSVHNVMEPAAMAKPILFGPTIQNAYETSLLLERGAAKLVRTPQQMAAVITKWLNSKEERIAAGKIGKQLIEENLGAVERTLAHLRKYV
jgi:3-deoxy-D-manno-octulosonic-acid transferase